MEQYDSKILENSSSLKMTYKFFSMCIQNDKSNFILLNNDIRY